MGELSGMTVDVILATSWIGHINCLDENKIPYVGIDGFGRPILRCTVAGDDISKGISIVEPESGFRPFCALPIIDNYDVIVEYVRGAVARGILDTQTVEEIRTGVPGYMVLGQAAKCPY